MFQQGTQSVIQIFRLVQEPEASAGRLLSFKRSLYSDVFFFLLADVSCDLQARFSATPIYKPVSQDKMLIQLFA